MRKRVLLTGASGSMGREAFRILWERRAEFEITLLLRPSRKNRLAFRKYQDELRIIWGDIRNKSDVEKACEGIDACRVAGTAFLVF